MRIQVGAVVGRPKREEGRSRERSRRNDRPRKPDKRSNEPQNELKKPKLDHVNQESEDELMEARSKAASPGKMSGRASVYDLTQADLDSDHENESPVHTHARSSAEGGAYHPEPGANEPGGHKPESCIFAPTPRLGAPTTPLDQLRERAQLTHPAIPPPWISDLLDSMATLHTKQDRTHQDILE